MDLYDSILHSDEAQPEQPVASTSKIIDLDSLAPLNAKADKTGVVYISRVPPGMGPSKLKHLLSHYGDTGRVYLARDPRDAKTAKAGKHTSHRFVEGWLEFLDKKVARSTAEYLNAQPIGGKPSNPFYHDLWSIKYLPRFKWSQLSASLGQSMAVESALLRNEISQSKKDQAGYLRQVEKARVQGKIEEKREKKRKERPEGSEEVPKKEKKQRAFKQRTTVKEGKQEKARGDQALQGVLDSLF